MTPADWERVDSLFQRAIELPPDERAPFVRREAGNDAFLREEVIALLSYDHGTQGGLESAVRSVAARVVEETEVVGQRVGIYRILRKIGEGGMGTVYLALRDDGEFRKEVAVKIVRLGMETPQFVERFRRERQILANLDHPYVARLLDGGAAVLPGRQIPLPYLVMEFVDGVPIHSFCRQNELRTADRCRLFLRVCEAVSHAHGQLIVHRDLKPGNILVTGDGVPKLLDFGIAQLMEQPERLDPNASRRPLTIDYASPEQVRGDTAGVGTDVYSLGAVLYELLTEVRPHRFLSYSAPEVERVICQSSLTPPSQAATARASELRGDLDAIVLKAMRKQPADRYGSVDEFRRDIDRYLRDLPVEARHGGFGYRARKFGRRHRWAVAGATIAVLGLAGGMAEATHQAHVAVEAQLLAEAAARDAKEAHATEQVQRQRAEQAAALAQKRQHEAELAQTVANLERTEAERRYGQVRELANRLLFEYQTEVAALPGSTSVRKKMVETGLAYVDTLAKDPTVGSSVRREMVDGWRRLGDLQGNPYVANLGDIQKSLTSYDRGLRIAESLGAEGRKPRIQLIVARGDVLSAAGDFAAAEAEYTKALTSAESTPTPDPILLSLIHEHRADLLERRGQITAALDLYQKAMDVSPRNLELGLHQKAGAVLTRLGRAPEALAHFQKALALCDEAAAHTTIDARVLRTRLWTLTGLADLYRTFRVVLHGTYADARGYIDQAIEVQDRLRAVDPFNQQYVRDWTLLEQRAASTNLADERFEDALRHANRAVEAAEMLVRMAPGQPQTDILVATSLVRLAKPLIHLNRFKEAEEAYNRAERALDLATRRNAADGILLRERYYLARDRYVLVYSEATAPKPSAELKAAVPLLREAIRINDQLMQREPNAAIIRADRTELQSDLAILLVDTGNPAEACVAFNAAVAFRNADKRPLRTSEIESFKTMEQKLPNCRKD